MITEKDLQAAIAECKGVRNPNANTCIKLAAYYTILDNLYGKPDIVQYSNATGAVDIGVDNAILNELDGKNPDAVWRLIAEFFDTVAVVEPKLYNAMLRQAREIPFR